MGAIDSLSRRFADWRETIVSDSNLLAFGCVVTFIALSGAYVYMRECFTAAEQTQKLKVKDK